VTSAIVSAASGLTSTTKLIATSSGSVDRISDSVAAT
jgi:hypothetical protein